MKQSNPADMTVNYFGEGHDEVETPAMRKLRREMRKASTDN